MTAERGLYVASDTIGNDYLVKIPERRARGTGMLQLGNQITFSKSLDVGMAFEIPGLGLFEVIKPEPDVLERYSTETSVNRIFLKLIGDEEFAGISKELRIATRFLPLTDESKKILGI